MRVFRFVRRYVQQALSLPCCNSAHFSLSSQTGISFSSQLFASLSVSSISQSVLLTMLLACALALLCVAAVRPVSAQKTSAVIIPNFSLNCDKPLVFNGQDNETACFAKCTPGRCQAVVHMFAGQPGKPTCALLPDGAHCKPEKARGPYTLKLNVPTKDLFSIRRTHNIGGGSGLPGILAFYHPVPASMSGYDACFAICQFLGCNAIQVGSGHCALFQYTKPPDVLMRGKSPICDATTLMYYENEKIATTGKCIETG